MGVLQEFERRLEGAVEGFFARMFRSGVQPIELARAVRRYGEDRQHITADGVVVPNVYRVTVGPKDHERLAGYGASLPRELAEVVVATASDRGWTLRGPARVKVEVDEEVRLGRFRLAGRVEAVEDSAYPGASRPASAARGAGRSADAGSANARSTARPAGAPGGPPVSPPPPGYGPGDAPGRSGGADSGPPVSPDPRPAIDRTQVISAVPATGLHLVVRNGGNAGTSVPVQGTRMTAGRSTDCDVTIDDSTVSREHAAFVRRGALWWVVDLGSTNGTRVNGSRAAEHPIEPGDRVQLGDAIVELVGG